MLFERAFSGNWTYLGSVVGAQSLVQVIYNRGGRHDALLTVKQGISIGFANVGHP